MEQKKSKRLKKQLLFKVINTAIILFFVFFYGGRLIYYYLQENGKKDENIAIALVDELIKKVSLIDQTNGLVDNKDGSYTYKGKTTQNYVKYSGRIFRIIGIDKDKNITMITEETQTVLMPGVNDYKTSYLRDWLELNEEKTNTGLFMLTLNNPYEFLEKTNTCLDKIDNIEKITCEHAYQEDYITLLSLNDYKQIGGSDSYLNNKGDYFLLTQTSDNKHWYVAADGGISIGNLMNETHGIRPVITIRNSTIVYQGNGTKDNPYIIENTKALELTQASISEYVSFSGYNWQIIGKDNDKVKLILSGYIKENDNEISLKYGTNNSYSLNINTIGYYLNNDFYDSLTNKELLLKTKHYYGKFTKYANFNYQDIYKNSIDAYVGLPSVGDLYINQYNNIFLSTRPYGDINIIYTINDNGNFFTDYVTNEQKIRPVIYLKRTNIKSGDGTFKTPYQLVVTSNE